MKAENNMEEEKLTKENAPLFLVLEITKKTIKLVYVDTPDYIADRVFQDCGINVKRLNEKRTTDSRFLYIGCRISGRDIKRFREAIEELERRFLLTGYRDYRTKVLSLLMQLVENEKKPETTTSAGSKEYPKSVLIPFIPQDSLDDILMAFYSLSNTKTYLPEVNILSKNPPRDKNGYDS